MTRINMQSARNITGTRDSVAWGKLKTIHNNFSGEVNALIFAAVLIVCSVAVGCSSEKPKTVSANNEIPMSQPQSQAAPVPAPMTQAESKPAPKKVVRKKPTTVNYTDKNYGVSFEYSRRYAIETGDAAKEVLTTSPIPMNFVAPGGVALAAVELPETGFANTDFSSAFFNVSVHKGLTADQCNEFAVPEPKIQETSAPVQAASNQPATTKPKPSPAATDQATAKSSDSPSTAAQTTNPAPAAATSSESKSESKSDSSTQPQSQPKGSKLMVGDLEMHATEAVSGEGSRQSDAKYFHVYQNGACYEFALNVTTVGSQDGLIKHVDRDRVFSRLEKILDTVKITPVAAPEVTAETPAGTPAAANPAQ
jgi:hypothetical protein